MHSLDFSKQDGRQEGLARQMICNSLRSSILEALGMYICSHKDACLACSWKFHDQEQGISGIWGQRRQSKRC